MGLFKKSKKEHDELLDLDSMEESLYHEAKKEEIKFPAFKPSHALTPNEVLSSLKTGVVSTAVPSKSNPLEALKQRMLSAQAENSEEEKEPEDTFTEQSTEQNDEEEFDSNKVYSTVGMFPDVKEVSPEINEDNIFKPDIRENGSLLPAEENHDHPITYMPKKHEFVNENEQFCIDVDSAIVHKDRSLLEKCSPYTVDDSGNDFSKNRPSDYTLESVSEILRSESDRALDDLSKKCNMTFDSLGKKIENVGSKPTEAEKPADKRTQAFTELVNESKNAHNANDILSELKEQGAEIEELDTSKPDISDIDSDSSLKPEPEVNEDISKTATVRFTPVKGDSQNTGTVIISNMTQPLDIKSELFSEAVSKSVPSQTDLEEEEFETLRPEDDEFTSLEDSKKFLRKFSLKKRSAFLKAVVSGLMFIFGLLFLIPPLSVLNEDFPKILSIILTSFSLISLIANRDIVLSLKDMFKKQCSSDVACFFSSLGLLINCLVTCVTKESKLEISCVYSAVLLLMLLFIRALTLFFRRSYELSNLKQIATKKPKKAVSLISDRGAAFAMAKNAIEGDALIAVSHPTDFAGDYVKYLKFGTILNGRLRILTIFGIISGIASAVIGYTVTKNLLTASFIFGAVLSFISIPTLFFIEVLPNFSAAAKLNRKGAMIAGKAAAERLEMANAIVMSSCDLFPAGTITLQNLKVLANNNIDDTLARAASLTEAVSSTLAPIFKKILKTNSAYTLPDSDTVKYEDRLGLSGWVDNELLFIGNRTLMEAHGIDIPSIEIDRKILHNGCFPIYVASKNTACALLIVRYDVDENVVRQLRYLTNLGVTVLINNSDPNINEEMLCDYFGLYSNSVKIMSNAGVHMYKTLSVKTPVSSAPAAFRSGQLTFISIMNSASKIKKSNNLLSFIYTLLSCFGIMFMVYYSAIKGNSGDLASYLPLLYSGVSALISILIYLIIKP